ncbi:hypothetical protein V2J09_009351 [Rumex salicifolius]
MHNLFLFADNFVHRPLLFLIWVFALTTTALPQDSAGPSSESSPILSSSPPAPSSMAAFSPGPLPSIGGSQMDTKNRKLVLALVIASASLGMCILSLFALWIYHKKKILDSPYNKKGKSSDSVKGFAPKAQPKCSINPLKLNGSRRSLNFDYKLLETATSNFDDGCKLGEGSFGCVYKAQLEEGYFVAVKKFRARDQDYVKEYENEVGLLSKIKHPNVIALLGHCSHEEKRYLVYELMEKGSLASQLHGPLRGSDLTWHTRMKIALDIARGLEYLHEHCNPPVIHRDLKSSNVLLDSNFNAKLSHFALADMHHNKTSIKLPGSLDYVAPEYLFDGTLTEKSDVYAFGVILLELVLGRKRVEQLSPSESQSIVKWAMPQLTDRTKLPSIVDPAMRDSMDVKHLYQVAAVAVLCVQPEPSYRPLITDVLHSLIPLVPVELGGSLRFILPSTSVKK